ncbi:MAG: hypothetical protein AAF724_07090 [Pseudomonadota bacterium]
MTEHLFEYMFGACPECGKSNGFLAIGPDHWGVCHRHGVKWSFVCDDLEGWKDQSDIERHQVSLLLAAYVEVQPVFRSMGGRAQ